MIGSPRPPRLYLARGIWYGVLLLVAWFRGGAVGAMLFEFFPVMLLITGFIDLYYSAKILDLRKRQTPRKTLTLMALAAAVAVYCFHAVHAGAGPAALECGFLALLLVVEFLLWHFEHNRRVQWQLPPGPGR